MFVREHNHRTIRIKVFIHIHYSGARLKMIIFNRVQEYGTTAKSFFLGGATNSICANEC